MDKTLLEHLEDLPAPIRYWAISNNRNKVINQEFPNYGIACNSIITALSKAFEYSKSPQGKEFWLAVEKVLEKNLIDINSFIKEPSILSQIDEHIYKFKKDVYLHLNAVLNSELGKSSDTFQIKFISELLEENNEKIKEIDPEFYFND